MFSLDFRWEILLVHVVVWVVVGVFVADAVTQFFVSAVVGVLEVCRDCGFGAFDGVHGCEDGVYCGVTFGGACHVGDCLGEDDLSFGHADAFDCLGGSDCYAEGLGIGVSDIFGGEDHDSSGNEFDIFSGVEHFSKVVDGCVRVRASHALDEGGDDVVMVVS